MGNTILRSNTGVSKITPKLGDEANSTVQVIDAIKSICFPDDDGECSIFLLTLIGCCTTDPNSWLLAYSSTLSNIYSICDRRPAMRRLHLIDIFQGNTVNQSLSNNLSGIAEKIGPEIKKFKN